MWILTIKEEEGKKKKKKKNIVQGEREREREKSEGGSKREESDCFLLASTAIEFFELSRDGSTIDFVCHLDQS